MELIPANSITFEVAHIMAQRCDCASPYVIHSQRLMEINGWPVDCITACCRGCQAERLFFFDIHTFYSQEEQESAFTATQSAPEPQDGVELTDMVTYPSAASTSSQCRRIAGSSSACLGTSDCGRTGSNPSA